MVPRDGRARQLLQPRPLAEPQAQPQAQAQPQLQGTAQYSALVPRDMMLGGDDQPQHGLGAQRPAHFASAPVLMAPGVQPASSPAAPGPRPPPPLQPPVLPPGPHLAHAEAQQQAAAAAWQLHYAAEAAWQHYYPAAAWTEAYHAQAATTQQPYDAAGAGFCEQQTCAAPLAALAAELHQQQPCEAAVAGYQQQTYTASLAAPAAWLMTAQASAAPVGRLASSAAAGMGEQRLTAASVVAEELRQDLVQAPQQGNAAANGAPTQQAAMAAAIPDAERRPEQSRLKDHMAKAVASGLAAASKPCTKGRVFEVPLQKEKSRRRRRGACGSSNSAAGRWRRRAT